MVDGPLPLVTATFTTDEIARCVAGLNLLRRVWAARALEIVNVDESARVFASNIVGETTMLIQRMSDLISPEQGSALMEGLIRDLQNRKRDVD
jgi:hypothetical protein